LFLLFFGVAGVIVGVLDLLGLSGPAWMQWVLFSVISVVSMLLFRKPLLKRFQLEKSSEVDQLSGEYAVASQDIEVDALGKAELRGSPWNAKNVGTQVIRAGQRCLVESVDGLVLFVKAV
jgi:membrane protein implicated in regulation of membrane protease activity